MWSVWYLFFKPPGFALRYIVRHPKSRTFSDADVRKGVIFSDTVEKIPARPLKGLTFPKRVCMQDIPWRCPQVAPGHH